MALVIPLVVCTACDATGWNGRASQPEDDIVAIRCFYSSLMPWLHDADGRVGGFQVRTYFLSARTGKGEFVSGPIHVTLNVLQRRQDGTIERTRVHEWRFAEQEAAGFRVIKRATPGDSYGFILFWPSSMNLMGKTIEISFYYQRSDGRFVNGPPHQMRVPVPPGFKPGPDLAPVSTRPATDGTTQ